MLIKGKSASFLASKHCAIAPPVQAKFTFSQHRFPNIFLHLRINKKGGGQLTQVLRPQPQRNISIQTTCCPIFFITLDRFYSTLGTCLAYLDIIDSLQVAGTHNLTPQICEKQSFLLLGCGHQSAPPPFCKSSNRKIGLARNLNFQFWIPVPL